MAWGILGVKIGCLTFINVRWYWSMDRLVLYSTTNLYSLFPGKTDLAYGLCFGRQTECCDIHSWQHMLNCRVTSFSVSAADLKSRKLTTELQLMNLTNSLFVSTLICGNYVNLLKLNFRKTLIVAEVICWLCNSKEEVCCDFWRPKSSWVIRL